MSDTATGISFSLAGCGFLGIYHIGVASCLKRHAPQLMEGARFGGASAGALLACCMVCEVDLNDCIDFTLRLARSARQHPLRGWEPQVDIHGILRSTLTTVLPDNAHELCSGRLFVSVTEMNTQNKMISHFKSKQSLIDAVLCSAFIPVFSGYHMAKFEGEWFVDGGLSNNVPLFDESTISISPWAGEHSICPNDPSGIGFPITAFGTSIVTSQQNALRFKDAFCSPPTEVLKQYLWQGYDDALRFLSENQLIHCHVHRVLTHLTHLERTVDPECEQCTDCHHHREHAQNSKVSEDLLAHWDNEEQGGAVAGHISRIFGFVTTPFKKFVEVSCVPLQILKDRILKLYFVAYFKAKNFNFSDELMRILKIASSPRAAMRKMCMEAGVFFLFTMMDYWMRVISTVINVQQQVRFYRRTPKEDICSMCGERYDHAAGTRIAVAGAEAEAESGVEQEEGAGPQLLMLPLHRAEKRQDDVPVITIERSADSDSAPRPSRSVAPPDVAFSMDIKARAKSISIPIPVEEEESEAEAARTRYQTVQVDGVGDIDCVQFNNIVLNRASIEGAAETQGNQPLAGSRRERVHQYVHQFDKYKNVMTMHYLDENHVRHTECLFTEDLPEEEADQTVPAKSRSQRKRRDLLAEGEEGGESDLRLRPRASVVLDGDLVEVEGAEGGSVEPKEKRPHRVGSELRSLLEAKVMQDTRAYETGYQREHQRRLKEKHRTEVTRDTGHFTLQVVSFSNDLPSPNLSRSSSIQNVSADDQASLVSSVVDAATLAKCMQDVQDRDASL